MNRRELLKHLAAGVVSVATGEVLVPAARTYFLPPRGGWPTRYFAAFDSALADSQACMVIAHQLPSGTIYIDEILQGMEAMSMLPKQFFVRPGLRECYFELPT